MCTALYSLITAFQYTASLDLSDRDHHLHAAGGETARRGPVIVPDLEHREIFCGQLWFIPSWDPFSHFLVTVLCFLWETIPLLFSVYQTWVGLALSPGSKGEEHVAWAWPIRVFRSLGHSNWFRGRPCNPVCSNNESWEFFSELLEKQGPFFLLESVIWLANKSVTAGDIFCKMRWWEVVGGSAETETNV